MRFPHSIRLRSLLLPFLLVTATVASAQDARKTQDAVTRMLQEFLAKNGEASQHERFWAADLVYTSSKGEVTGKAEIMKSFEGSKPDPAVPADTYSADDILVRPYGTMAALTFRLIRHAPDGTLHYYRNSGTLLLRSGQWQVVTWQATMVPDVEAKPTK
jgi:hypothetical protein